MIGHNQYGHPEFETSRSNVGELLYQLKYRHDKTAIEPLADTAADFVGSRWKLSLNAIIPVPPSNSRIIQPVMVVAEALSERLGVLLCKTCLTKVKQTPQLKDITDYHSRKETLADAFTVAAKMTTEKNVLLFDDLYGSGATVSHIVDVLQNQGRVRAVYLLTLTTKSK